MGVGRVRYSLITPNSSTSPHADSSTTPPTDPTSSTGVSAGLLTATPTAPTLLTSPSGGASSPAVQMDPGREAEPAPIVLHGKRQLPGDQEDSQCTKRYV